MNAWGESCQYANQHMFNAVDAMDELFVYFERHIEGKTRIPTKTTDQMRRSFNKLVFALNSLAKSVEGIADAQNAATMALLAGHQVTRQQFYILLATGCVEWTNKSFGLAELDDFELFHMLRYESEDRNGYIHLGAAIDDSPAVRENDWVFDLLLRTYGKVAIAPETLHWRSLSARQRAFFRRNLPDVIERFAHSTQEPEAVNPDNSYSR